MLEVGRNMSSIIEEQFKEESPKILNHDFLLNAHGGE